MGSPLCVNSLKSDRPMESGRVKPEKTRPKPRWNEDAERKRLEDQRYLSEHPEFKAAMQDYVTTVLRKRPDNIEEFTIEYFAKLSQ